MDSDEEEERVKKTVNVKYKEREPKRVRLDSADFPSLPIKEDNEA